MFDKKEKKLCRLSLWIGLFLSGLFCINGIFEDKSEKENMYSIKYEERGTIDVIFFGNSHANQAFLPMELWREHGYTSYNMAQVSQTFPLVYYCIEDAIKLQHPDLIVVDLFAATSYSNDFDNMHKTLDNLTFTTRMQAINEFVAEDKKTEYIFPLYVYHERWASLELRDFYPYILRFIPEKNVSKGARLMPNWEKCEVPENAVEFAFNGETNVLPEEAVYWYKRLKQLCDENNAEAIFVVVPYQMPVESTEEATIEQMKLYNATEEWCNENEVGYLNLFRNLDEMDFDYSTDMQDVSHVNILGAEKVTEFVGEYISENCVITDSRDNISTKTKWDGFYEAYLKERNEAIAACKGLQME